MVRFARELAGLSICERDQVGAIVFPPDFSNVRSIGYNGPSMGAPHACRNVEGDCGCAHAELNAALKLGPETGGIMFSTRCPCERCAQAIVNCRKIAWVVYDLPYRNDLGLVALAHGKVAVVQHRVLESETLFQSYLQQWRSPST